jgi:hypothetical protein
MSSWTERVARFVDGRDCVFRTATGPRCLITGKAMWCRPCRLFLRSDGRLKDLLPAAALVVSRAKTQTDHLLTITSLLVAATALVLSLLRYLEGR